MDKKVKIAIDLMGGENSPDKNLDGIELFIKRNKNLNDYFKNRRQDQSLTRLFYHYLKHLLSDTLKLFFQRS